MSHLWSDVGPNSFIELRSKFSKTIRRSSWESSMRFLFASEEKFDDRTTTLKRSIDILRLYVYYVSVKSIIFERTKDPVNHCVLCANNSQRSFYDYHIKLRRGRSDAILTRISYKFYQSIIATRESIWCRICIRTFSEWISVYRSVEIIVITSKRSLVHNSHTSRDWLIFSVNFVRKFAWDCRAINFVCRLVIVIVITAITAIRL